MLKSILLSLIFTSLIFSCQEPSETSENGAEQLVGDSLLTEIVLTEDAPSWNGDQTDDSVNVQLSIDHSEEKVLIETNVELFGDAWIVSPLAKDYPWGKMSLSIEENEFIELDDKVFQSPEAVLMSDENTEDPYELITGLSTITQELTIKKLEDFEIEGVLFYVLEPICQPFQIEFRLISTSGEVSIGKSELVAIPT